MMLKSDVKMTGYVFLEQLKHIEDTNPQKIYEMSASHIVDPDGKFYRDENKEIRFNFGKHKDNKVSENKRYLSWMLEANFSPLTKSYARHFLRLK